MADKVRERNPDKMAEKSAANNPTLLRTVPDGGVGMRMEEQEKGSLHLSNQPPGTVPPPRKKTSSFQITSVTVGSRLSNDGGDDSADDLDESHTEDISSELLDISKTTDLDNDYSSEDAFSSVDQIPMPATAVGAMHPLLHHLPNNGQGDASQVSNVNVVNNPEDAHDRSVPWHTRFRVVKIESTEPFKRGRWICMDFLDPPPSQTESCDTREGGSGNSSAASSVHYSESYIEIPIGQEMFYQQSDSQHHAVPVQALHHSVTVGEQQPPQQQQHNAQQQGLVSGQTQQQSMGQQGLTDYQNVGCVVPNQQQQQQHQGQSLGLNQQQGNVPPTSIMPNQQIPVHHGGSLPVPLQGQQQQPSAAVPQQGGEFYNVPQTGGGTLSAPQTQNEFQGAPVPGCDYSGGGNVQTSGMHHTEYGQVHPDYGQVHQDYGQVHTIAPTSVSAGMMPVDYSGQAQTMQPPGDYGMPQGMPPQGDYMNMHQQQTEFMNVHQQSHIGQGIPPQQEYMHQQGEYGQAQSMGPGPNLQQQQQQCNSMPPQGDYSLQHQQPGAHMTSDFSHNQSVNQQGNVMPSNMGQGSAIPSSVGQQVPQQQQSQSCVPQQSNMPPQSQSLPNTVPQSISSIGDYGVGQVNAPSNSQPTSNIVPPLSMSNQPQSGSSEQQAYSVSSSRPSTISLSSSALEGGEPIGSLSVAVTPPVLDNLGVAGKDGDDTESFSALAAFLGNDRHCYKTQLHSAVIRKANMYSASGSSTVAIDNKIEQAMDLVKSHLMFAVREEVDVLKEKITELMDRINQLEYENSILRAAASQETLAKLTQPPPKPPPPNPSS